MSLNQAFYSDPQTETSLIHVTESWVLFGSTNWETFLINATESRVLFGSTNWETFLVSKSQSQAFAAAELHVSFELFAIG